MGDPGHLVFCGIPRSGFWMLDDDVELLDAEFPVSDDSWATRANNPNYTYDRDGDGWPLTGFTADLAVATMSSIDWLTFSARMFPSYTEALYATSKTHECDVAFSPFTVTQNRTYCGNVSLASGVRACTDPANASIAPGSSDACCADFSFQLMPSTVGVLLESGAIVTNEFLDAYVINLFLICVFMELLLAHAVWVVETCSTKSRQFNRVYDKGIWDSIYWATCTVTSVGYGDFAPTTCLGKLLTVIGMFLGLVFTAVLTASISSKLTAGELQVILEISSVSE